MDDNAPKKRKKFLVTDSAVVVGLGLLATVATITLFVFNFYASVNIGNGRVIYQREGAQGELQTADNFTRCFTRAATANMYDRDAQDRAIAVCSRASSAAARRDATAPLVTFLYFTNQGPTAMEDVVVDTAFQDATGHLETHRFSRPFVSYEEVFRQNVRLSSEPTKAIICISYHYGPGARMYVTMRGEPSLNTGILIRIDGRMTIVRSHWRFSIFDACQSDIQEALASSVNDRSQL